MKVAAIYDLHGNLPALEVVVEEIRRMRVEEIVVGGDIFPGPMPCEMLEFLLNLEIPTHFIKGNGEIDALSVMHGESLDRVPKQYQDIVIWSAKQVYPKYENLIDGWAKTLNLEIEGIGKVLFCHATPRDDNEIFTIETPEANLLPIFEKVEADLIICGHTHIQFDRMIGKKRVINAGSLGMPFGEPLANWLLLGDEIQLRRTAYNLENAAKRIRKTNYPQAEDFATNSILQTPSEEFMLEIFSKAEMN